MIPRTSGFASIWQRRFDASGVAQGNSERHDDHASESEIEIHKVFILKPVESGAILNRLNAKEKFALLIPMIETIDTRPFVFARGFG